MPKIKNGRKPTKKASRARGPRQTKVIATPIVAIRRNMVLNANYKRNISKERLVSVICSKINPFCKESVGSKISDEASAFTTPFQSRFIAALTSDANGNTAFWFNPSINVCYAYGSTISGGGLVTAFTGVNSPDYSAVAAYEEYRVVSYGVRIITTQAWTTAQGVSIGSILNTVPAASVVNVGSMANGQEVSAYAVRDLDVTFIGKPSDHTFSEFTATGNTGGIADSNSPDFTSFLFTGNGLSASIPFGAAEVIINYELKTKAGITSTLQQLGTAPSKANNALMELVAHTRYQTPSIVDTSSTKNIDNTLMSMATKALASAAPSILEQAMMGLAFLL